MRLQGKKDSQGMDAEQGFEAPPVADEAMWKPGEQRRLSNGREDSRLLRT